LGIALDFDNNGIVIGELDVGDEEWPWSVLEGFTTKEYAWIERDGGPAILLYFVFRHVCDLEVNG
jgi:hypothetical protein